MSKKGGLLFIANQQRPDGGFLAYSVTHPTRTYRTTFVPSLIALALHDVPGSGAVQKRIAKFLLAQKSADWSWNYWDRKSVHVRKTPYPDDLDDTFLALAHLWRYDKSLFTPALMARLAHLLFVTETEPGGPYVTWVADETADKAWRDVDVIVNSNIAAFLDSQGVSLPPVTTLIEDAVEQNRLVSPYYPGLLPGAYLLARWYRGSKTEKLKQLVLAQQADGVWSDAHQTALAMSTLLRLDYPAGELKKAAQYLARHQQTDGSWQAGPMYIVDVEYGAPALTTALCLEALALYSKASRTSGDQSRHGEPAMADEEVINEVRSVVDNLPQADLRRHTAVVLERILSQDTDRQIVLLPKLVAQFAHTEVSAKTLRGLAAISLWGWMAYTGFDDFLDQEGDPKLLPSAVLAHRYMFAAVRSTMAGNMPFQAEVTDILNRLDGANAWEASHCRGVVKRNRLFIEQLPDYSDLWQLADRSLGHVIAGVGVLYDAGYASTSPEMTGLREFFRNYLIARQLNDDAHDWQDDLSRGHVNAVAVLVLQKWLEGRGRTLRKGIDLATQGDTLRLIMWEHVISQVCMTIDQHIIQARAVVNELDAFDAAPLLALLLPIEQASRTALRSRDDALEFISQL